MRLFSVVSGKLTKKLKARNKEMKQQPPIISPVVLIRWLLGYTRLTVSSFYDLPITSWVAVIRWWLGDNQEKKVHVHLPPPVSQFGSQLSDDDTELLLDTRKNVECCELSVEPTNYQKRVPMSSAILLKARKEIRFTLQPTKKDKTFYMSFFHNCATLLIILNSRLLFFSVRTTRFLNKLLSLPKISCKTTY